MIVVVVTPRKHLAINFYLRLKLGKMNNLMAKDFLK